MKKRYAMTLLEIMIVILIIGVIGSVIGVNMRGSLEESKVFKSREGIRQLYDIYQLELAKGDTTIDDILNDPEEVLKNSGLARKPHEMLQDGWKEEYTFTKTRDGDIRIHSKKYESHYKKKESEPEYPW